MSQASGTDGPKVGGAPTPEEVAAAIAAVELSWPRAAAAPEVDPSAAPAWRLSGRWWSEQPLANRPRP